MKVDFVCFGAIITCLLKNQIFFFPFILFACKLSVKFRLTVISKIVVEKNRFDTQKLQNPEIKGVEYQQGELFSYELREYLLLKWQHQCAYCDAKKVPLEIDHILARSKGGSNRVSNLTLACHKCNQSKGKKNIEKFLAKKPDRCKKILAQSKKSLKDAAAVNSIRHAICKKT